MTLVFMSTTFLLLFFPPPLPSTVSLPRMAGIKLITAIQLWRKKKRRYGLQQRNLKSKRWKENHVNQSVDYHKRKRKGMLKSHPTNATVIVRMEFLTEATALLSKQALTQDTVRSAKFSQPACEPGPGDTLHS